MTKDKLAIANTVKNRIDVSAELHKALIRAMGAGDRVAKVTIEIDTHKNETVWLGKEFIVPIAKVVKELNEGWENELEKL